MGHSLKAGVLRGRKIGGRHTTLIPVVQRILPYIKGIEPLSRVFPGVIRPTRRGAKTTYKMALTSRGIQLKIRGPGAVQTLWIICDEPSVVAGLIRETMTQLGLPAPEDPQ